MGLVGFNGDINTGILIRTVHLKDGVARYPAGATLLYDSVPEAEEAGEPSEGDKFLPLALSKDGTVAAERAPESGEGMKLLFVDNDDCFIHTLANYSRQTGAEVLTYRAQAALDVLDDLQPDMC